MNLQSRPPARWHSWLVRALGPIVPRGIRADWLTEWQAELDARETELRAWGMVPRRAAWQVLRDSTGAFWDALWLQTHRWEDELPTDTSRPPIRSAAGSACRL